MFPPAAFLHSRCIVLEFPALSTALRTCLWVLILLVCGIIPLWGQDIDVSPSIQKRSPATIAEQIGDPAERAAFLQLFQQAPPLQMRERADKFLSGFPQSAYRAQAYEVAARARSGFPQSAYRAQAYEVAARASFDLQNFKQGLADAQRSLSMLPENPMLLTAVADVEAHQDLDSDAIVHADEAFEGLLHCGPPSSVPESKWPALRRNLESSALFSKGRALLKQALGTKR